MRGKLRRVGRPDAAQLSLSVTMLEGTNPDLANYRLINASVISMPPLDYGNWLAWRVKAYAMPSGQTQNLIFGELPGASGSFSNAGFSFIVNYIAGQTWFVQAALQSVNSEIGIWSAGNEITL